MSSVHASAFRRVFGTSPTTRKKNKNAQIPERPYSRKHTAERWVCREWWVICEASSQVVKHVQPVIELHILVWSENMIWSLPTFSPFRPSLPGSPPSPGDPCKVWWKETHLSPGLHLLSHTHTCTHTLVSFSSSQLHWPAVFQYNFP